MAPHLPPARTYCTVHRAVTVEGIGIHTGTSSRVTLSPASPGAGVVFRRDGVEIAAHVDNVVDTSRCTVLGKNGVTVSTVEHLMSAFAGNRTTDAVVDVAGTELPIGDGSANIWIEAFKDNNQITRVPIAEDYDYYRRLELRIVLAGANGSFIAAYPSNGLSMTVAVVFDHPLAGTQIHRFTRFYEQEIAPARTFGFIEEVEALRNAGLALGGSEENAVVVYPDRYSRPLRFPNELARHKLLDLIGDLALAGLPLPNMEIFAVKPSHRLNVEFARALVAAGT